MGAVSFLFVLVCLCLSVVASNAGMQCTLEFGKPVDWWFLYKLPDGYRYAYKDSTMPDAQPLQIAPAPYFINRTTDGPLGSTLHQVYEDKTGENTAYAIYNDERPPTYSTPDWPSSDSAHAKGVMASDGTTGFWLVHSTPKFPDLNAINFTFPRGGTIYGQSFLCLSLSNEEINTLALNLQVGLLLCSPLTCI